MWELYHNEGWVPKNWCFWTVMLEKTLESPLDCKDIKPINPKGNQALIFIKDWIHWNSLESWSWSSTTLVTWFRVDLSEKILMLGKIEGRSRREWQMTRWLDGITNSMDMSLSELQEMVEDRESWRAADHGVVKSWTQQRDWTTTKWKKVSLINQYRSINPKWNVANGQLSQSVCYHVPRIIFHLCINLLFWGSCAASSLLRSGFL